MEEVTVLDKKVSYYSKNEGDYISLTDIAKHKDLERTDQIIQNWLRSRYTIELLGLWEKINNSDFKPLEFEGFKQKAGLNYFVLTPKQWIEKTGAIGIVSKQGNNGGTFAHKDIAFEFASWISVEFKLYLIKEFQRLKIDENQRLKLDWDIKRNLAKINYRIHTDAIKNNLIPQIISKTKENIIYATEADILNLALFGLTAKEWKEKNPKEKGNIRDYADVSQLVCLSNLENLNALFIKEGISKLERLKKLNHIAIEQMIILTKDDYFKLMLNAQKIKMKEVWDNKEDEE